ncbi:lysylphosphatidylglycerol synthase transmembrane domain-containing protein [Spirosoma sp. KNUC1025]|uniref:lysylphosphatidylglycerol synthase transmembrane domain-containing protein n=1 Tax=Spirosoma sp. KNUC1025 TaxID=2894082 RepID=UPI003870CC46
MNKTLVRQGLPILLAIGLLWYVLRDIPISALAVQFRQANYGWLALFGLILVFYHLVRAARWQLTLHALGYRPSLLHTTVAMLAGMLASMIVPGAGELTRCGTLQRTDNVPITQGIGSVVAERVVDLLMLGLLVGLTFLLEFKRVGYYLLGLLSPLQTRLSANNSSLLVGLLVAGVLAAGLIYWLFRRIAFRQHPVVIRLITIGRGIGNGFMGIQRIKRPWLFIGFTLLSYMLVFLATYVLFFTSSQTLTLPQQPP